MRIARSARAENDLIDIWVSIARNSEKAADRMVDALDKRTKSLLAHPRLGRIRPDIAPGIRALVVQNYLILYRFDDETIDILRYVHGKRRLREMV